jgi:RNA polymerase sigma-32 factor
MSREEELSLFDRWKTGGDDRALHTLVLAYEPLVTRIVGGLRRNGISVEDAKQEARCGLLEAARCFDPSRGFRFGTYARWWMLSAVSTYLVANKDVLSSRRMKQKPKLLPLNFVSLDAPITPDGESAAELIASDEEGPDLIAENAIDGERMHHRLANALNSLEPREKLVLQRRHLKDEAETLQTVANDLHITAERVRQIEKTALTRLRNGLESS